MTCKDFEEAKEYLREKKLWDNLDTFRLSGYEIVGIANTHRKKEKK